MNSGLIPMIPKWWAASVLTLLLLLTGHGFGEELPDLAPGPGHVWSKVNYDPKLTDPFFKSNEWSYWTGGHSIDPGMIPEGEKPRKLKHTAKCFSNSRGVKHEVRFCEAKFRDEDKIDLLIEDATPAFDDCLIIRIRNGMFWCEYGIVQKGPVEPIRIWPKTKTKTKTRQELTLNKRRYRKGDVIKGRISYEVVLDTSDPKDVEKATKYFQPIKIYGVFKTIVE